MGLWDGPSAAVGGAVGSGFDDRTLVTIRSKLDALERAATTFHPDQLIPGRLSLWVEPEMVAEVYYKQWTAGPRLRAPVFKGLSATPAEDATWETAGPGAVTSS